LQDAIHRVQQFHEAFGVAVANAPSGVIPAELRARRIRLLEQELEEYKHASASGDIVAVADALTDLAYVLFGAYVTHGLQDLADALFDKVHRSNTSRRDENGRSIGRMGKCSRGRAFRSRI
jgi:predicted HAD superfamily Cof-like phosphohydrolase